jgi:hypothetical protein
MRVRCSLRDGRGDRSLREILQACPPDDLPDGHKIAAGTLSLIELGRLLPTEAQADWIVRAYGLDSITDAYSPLALLAIQEDGA